MCPDSTTEQQLTYTPILDGAIPKKIHPALDFAETHAYVGQILPCRCPDGSHKGMLCLITATEIFVATEEKLEEKGIQLLHKDLVIGPRWSRQGINQFLQDHNSPEATNLFEKIKAVFQEYIEFPKQELYNFITLWNIGTYFFPLLNSYPYIYIGGIKISGKTKVLDLSACIGFNSISSGNMSTASLYRLIQNCRCSLLIDETEKLSNRYRAQDFRNILLSGYKKGQRTYRAERTPSDSFVPKSFEIYGPKMLANIQGLEDVLESRCIKIIMKRGLNTEVTNKEVDINDPRWQQLRDLLYPFLFKNWQEIKETYSALENETELANRNWELWKPILALAKFFDGENSSTLYNEMRSLAREKAEERQRESSESPESILVEVLSLIVNEDGYYPLSSIRAVMSARIEGEWLNNRFIGSTLKRLGFSNSKRARDGYKYFLRVSEVQDCARRLGISVRSEGSERSEGTTEEAEDQTSESEQVEASTS